MHALRGLGLDDAGLERAGIRILKLGMIWPLEHEIDARLRARPRRDPRRRGEGAVPRDAPEGRALRAGGCPAHPRQARRARRAAPAARARARRRPDRPRRGRAARGARSADRLGGGAPAQARGDPRPARRVADGAAHALLLLRLPAQQLGQGARGHARRWRHRLPHDGAAEPRGQGRDHRHHADGRRGRAVDRHGAVHGRQPPRAEPGRRHLPPLGLARDPRRRRGRGEHHLQAALQRARRDDGWPGDRGTAQRAGPHPLARARGRPPDHRHYRGHEPLPGRGAIRDRRAARPQGAARLAAGAGRGRGRHGADPRPGVRGRAAPPAQARQGRRARPARVDQRAGLRGLRRLRGEVELPLGSAGRDRVRPQDPDPPGLLQQGLLMPRGRLPAPSSPSSRARRQSTAPRRSTSSCRSRGGWSAPTTSASA